eukprot:1193156-Prorocentrum_minimum.AAC.7
MRFECENEAVSHTLEGHVRIEGVRGRPLSRPAMQVTTPSVSRLSKTNQLLLNHACMVGDE